MAFITLRPVHGVNHLGARRKVNDFIVGKINNLTDDSDPTAFGIARRSRRRAACVDDTQLDRVTAGQAIVVSSVNSAANGVLALTQTTSNSMVAGGLAPFKGQPGLTDDTGAADGAATAVGTNLAVQGEPPASSGTSVTTAGSPPESGGQFNLQPDGTWRRWRDLPGRMDIRLWLMGRIVAVAVYCVGLSGSCRSRAIPPQRL